MKKVFLFFGLLSIPATFLWAQPASNAAAKGRLLKFNPLPGEEYEYEIGTSSLIETKGEESTSYESFFVLSVRLERIEKNVRILSVAYKNIQGRFSVGGEETNYGSSTGDYREMEPVNMLNSAMIGKRFTLRVDETGDILGIAGYEEVIADFIDTARVSEEKKKILQTIQQYNNARLVEDGLEQYLDLYPNKEVVAGDSWTRAFTTKGLPGLVDPQRTTIIYTVKKIEGDLITLDLKSRSEPLMKMEIAGASKKEIITTRLGEMVIDSRSGWVIHADITSNIVAKEGEKEANSTGKDWIRGKIN